VSSFIRDRIVKPAMTAFRNCQRSTEAMLDFTTQKLPAIRNKPEFATDWAAAVEPHIEPGARAAVSAGALRLMLQYLLGQVSRHLQRSAYEQCGARVGVGGTEAPPLDDLEKQKVYYIAGYIVQDLQLREVLRRAELANVRWNLVLAYNALRVCKDSPDVPAGVSAFQQVGVGPHHGRMLARSVAAMRLYVPGHAAQLIDTALPCRRADRCCIVGCSN